MKKVRVVFGSDEPELPLVIAFCVVAVFCLVALFAYFNTPDRTHSQGYYTQYPHAVEPVNYTYNSGSPGPKAPR